MNALEALTQFLAFENTTMGCARCERQAPLNSLEATPWGWVCLACLRELSSDEWEDLRAQESEFDVE